MVGSVGYSFLLLFLVVALLSQSYATVNDLGSSLMRQMWMTPIQLYTLADADLSGLSRPTLNGNILNEATVAVLDHLDTFKKSSHYFDKDATKSDLYYIYQQNEDQRYKLCMNSNSPIPCENTSPAVYANLSVIFHQAVVNYLNECFLDVAAEKVRTQRDYMQNIHIWSSVHANGSYHSPHHHKDAQISGILYLTAPPGAGAVVFNDPRGQLPPFGRSLQILPKPGQLILFPSWLVHGVLPSLTTQPRVSVSFNYQGAWEVTSDVSLAFYT